MTEIYCMGAGLLQGCVMMQSKKDFNLEDVFKMLSIEMGGDGKTITKKQLEDYIKKIQSGQLSVSKSRLKALLHIQKNWDSISHGKDSISYENLKGCPDILASMVTGGFEVIEVPEAQSSTIGEITDFLKKKHNLKNLSDVTKSQLEEYLKALIEEDKNSENSEQISTVVNLLAAYDDTSTVQEEV